MKEAIFDDLQRQTLSYSSAHPFTERTTVFVDQKRENAPLELIVANNAAALVYELSTGLRKTGPQLLELIDTFRLREAAEVASQGVTFDLGIGANDEEWSQWYGWFSSLQRHDNSLVVKVINPDRGRAAIMEYAAIAYVLSDLTDQIGGHLTIPMSTRLQAVRKSEGDDEHFSASLLLANNAYRLSAESNTYESAGHVKIPAMQGWSQWYNWKGTKIDIASFM